MDAVTLLKIMPRAADAQAWAAALTAAMAEFDISTWQRQAAFLAQVTHETSELSALSENLFYTTPDRIKAVWPTHFASVADAVRYTRAPQLLANRVYAGRNGNGDEASGDGYRYRGRGPVHTTGKGNYRATGTALGYDLVADPDALQKPAQGARAGAWYFASHGCNALADKGDIDGITRAINGAAMEGSVRRRAYWFQARTIIQGAIYVK